jgi:hypothetical protein
MQSIQKEYISKKKEGIAEAHRWHNIVMKKELIIANPQPILLSPDFLKKERITVCSESKYFIN